MRSIGRPPPSKITPTQEPVTRVPGERAVTKVGFTISLVALLSITSVSAVSEIT